MEICEVHDSTVLAALNEEVQSLHHELYPEIFKPYNQTQVAEFFQEVLLQDNVTAFVAKENGLTLGYVLLFAQSVAENPFQYERRFLLLDQIVVSTSNRNQGVGALLLDKTFAFAKSLNLEVVELNHWTLNESARNFFNRHGFSYFNEKMSIRL